MLRPTAGGNFKPDALREKLPEGPYPPSKWEGADLNVRFGSKADMCIAIGRVRFTPKSGHEMPIRDRRRLSVG
jgi:hypothetical protein